MPEGNAPADRLLLVPDAVVVRADADVAVGAALLIENGRVASVGPPAALRRSAPLAPVRELPGRVLLPGLVDGHSHLRGLPTCAHDIPDGPLEQWVVRLAAMAPVDPGADALVAAVDAVSTGITTTQVLHHAFAGEDGYLAALAGTVAGLRTAGLNAEVVVALTDQSEFIPAELEAELDEEQRRWLVPDRGVGPDRFDALVTGAEALLAAASDPGPSAPWLRLGVAPVGPQWASDRLLATIARHTGPERRVHTHAVETRAQRAWGPESPIDRLERHGLLTSATSIAHAVHVTDAEVALLAAAGTAIVSCPTSNARVSDGSGDVVGWLTAGVTVGLGLDSVGHPELPDAFAELRTLQTTARARARHLDARTALSIATLGGAIAAGRADRIGTLEPGRDADLIAVRTPGVWRDGDEPDLIEGVVATSTRASITDVFSAGAPVVVDGRHRAADAVRAARDSLTEALRATAPERARRRTRIAALEPLVERVRHERTRAAATTR